MSLIVCDEACKHQKEGYCTLNHITRLTGEVTAKCGYYEAKERVAPQQEPPLDWSGFGDF